MCESQGNESETKRPPAWIYTAPTGNSLAERVHNVNRAVNALWARNIPETKVMVGRTATGWWLSRLDMSGLTVSTEECGTLDALHAALAARQAALNAQAKAA